MHIRSIRENYPREYHRYLVNKQKTLLPGQAIGSNPVNQSEWRGPDNQASSPLPILTIHASWWLLSLTPTWVLQPLTFSPSSPSKSWLTAAQLLLPRLDKKAMVNVFPSEVYPGVVHTKGTFHPPQSWLKPSDKGRMDDVRAMLFVAAILPAEVHPCEILYKRIAGLFQRRKDAETLGFMVNRSIWFKIGDASVIVVMLNLSDWQDDETKIIWRQLSLWRLT